METTKAAQPRNPLIFGAGARPSHHVARNALAGKPRRDSWLVMPAVGRLTHHQARCPSTSRPTLKSSQRVSVYPPSGVCLKAALSKPRLPPLSVDVRTQTLLPLPTPLMHMCTAAAHFSVALNWGLESWRQHSVVVGPGLLWNHGACHAQSGNFTNNPGCPFTLIPASRSSTMPSFAALVRNHQFLYTTTSSNDIAKRRLP